MHATRTDFPPRQKGMTLVELMLVLTLGLGIIIGGLMWFQSVQEGQRLNEGVQNLNAVTTAVRSMFNSQGHYGGLTEAVAMKASGFPRAMDSGTAGHMKHPWADDASAVTIAPATGATPQEFNITWAAVPEEACANIGAQTYNAFNALRINGTVVTGVAQVATSCSGASNTLQWTLR